MKKTRAAAKTGSVILRSIGHCYNDAVVRLHPCYERPVDVASGCNSLETLCHMGTRMVSIFGVPTNNASLHAPFA